jgi:hypothetical protein
VKGETTGKTIINHRELAAEYRTRRFDCETYRTITTETALIDSAIRYLEVEGFDRNALRVSLDEIVRTGQARLTISYGACRAAIGLALRHQAFDNYREVFMLAVSHAHRILVRTVLKQYGKENACVPHD